MGIYRATISQPEARVGKNTPPLDDTDRSVQLRVANGYLVPVDDVAINFQNELIVVETPVIDRRDAVKAAILAARAQVEAEADAPGLASFGQAPTAETFLPREPDVPAVEDD